MGGQGQDEGGGIGDDASPCQKIVKEVSHNATVVAKGKMQTLNDLKMRKIEES